LEGLTHFAIHVFLPPPNLAGARECDPLAVIPGDRFDLAAPRATMSAKLNTQFNTASSMFISLEASCHDISAKRGNYRDCHPIPAPCQGQQR
jgi:hypothetical protein